METRVRYGYGEASKLEKSYTEKLVKFKKLIDEDQSIDMAQLEEDCRNLEEDIYKCSEDARAVLFDLQLGLIKVKFKSLLKTVENDLPKYEAYAIAYLTSITLATLNYVEISHCYVYQQLINDFSAFIQEEKKHKRIDIAKIEKMMAEEFLGPVKFAAEITFNRDFKSLEMVQSFFDDCDQGIKSVSKRAVDYAEKEMFFSGTAIFYYFRLEEKIKAILNAKNEDSRLLKMHEARNFSASAFVFESFFIGEELFPQVLDLQMGLLELHLNRKDVSKEFVSDLHLSIKDKMKDYARIAYAPEISQTELDEAYKELSSLIERKPASPGDFKGEEKKPTFSVQGRMKTIFWEFRTDTNNCFSRRFISISDVEKNLNSALPFFFDLLASHRFSGPEYILSSVYVNYILDHLSILQKYQSAKEQYEDECFRALRNYFFMVLYAEESFKNGFPEVLRCNFVKLKNISKELFLNKKEEVLTFLEEEFQFLSFVETKRNALMHSIFTESKNQDGVLEQIKKAAGSNSFVSEWHFQRRVSFGISVLIKHLPDVRKFLEIEQAHCDAELLFRYFEIFPYDNKNYHHDWFESALRGVLSSKMTAKEGWIECEAFLTKLVSSVKGLQRNADELIKVICSVLQEQVKVHENDSNDLIKNYVKKVRGFRVELLSVIAKKAKEEKQAETKAAGSATVNITLNDILLSKPVQFVNEINKLFSGLSDRDAVQQVVAKAEFLFDDLMVHVRESNVDVMFDIFSGFLIKQEAFFKESKLFRNEYRELVFRYLQKNLLIKYSKFVQSCTMVNFCSQMISKVGKNSPAFFFYCQKAKSYEADMSLKNLKDKTEYKQNIGMYNAAKKDLAAIDEKLLPNKNKEKTPAKNEPKVPEQKSTAAKVTETLSKAAPVVTLEEKTAEKEMLTQEVAALEEKIRAARAKNAELLQALSPQGYPESGEYRYQPMVSVRKT